MDLNSLVKDQTQTGPALLMTILVGLLKLKTEMVVRQTLKAFTIKCLNHLLIVMKVFKCHLNQSVMLTTLECLLHQNFNLALILENYQKLELRWIGHTLKTTTAFPIGYLKTVLNHLFKMHVLKMTPVRLASVNENVKRENKKTAVNKRKKTSGTGNRLLQEEAQIVLQAVHVQSVDPIISAMATTKTTEKDVIAAPAAVKKVVTMKLVDVKMFVHKKKENVMNLKLKVTITKTSLESIFMRIISAGL